MNQITRHIYIIVLLIASCLCLLNCENKEQQNNVVKLDSVALDSTFIGKKLITVMSLLNVDSTVLIKFDEPPAKMRGVEGYLKDSTLIMICVDDTLDINRTFASIKNRRIIGLKYQDKSGADYMFGDVAWFPLDNKYKK